MHQRLRLSRADVKYGARRVQQFQQSGIIWSNIIDPGDERSIASKTFHTDVFLDGNWDTVERTDGLTGR